MKQIYFSWGNFVPSLFLYNIVIILSSKLPVNVGKSFVDVLY